MKTLYISDLDGTLLGLDAEISDFTQIALNRIIENGTCFSIATARTAATVLKMIDRIHINVPIILMNGVSVYDIQAGRYVKTHYIEQSSVSNLLGALKTHDTTGFLYTLERDGLRTYYEKIDSDNAREFIEERVKKYHKHFTQIDDFNDLGEKAVIYFSVCDEKEKLMPLYEEFRKDGNLHVEFYHNIYAEDSWYLEACSSLASKHNAVSFLRKEYGFDTVVSFGDNLNDLPLFLASDECYAVANAKPELKEKATAVIGGNADDGVARWLLERTMADSGR